MPAKTIKQKNKNYVTTGKESNRETFISVRGAKEHNLKNIDIDIPRGKLVVITGLSGSGKSSLAFDTIYAEGQRRYVESLSAYARQFLNIQDKPDVESIDGLSPAIAIDQKTTSKNPRSTVGTVTEIYDYLRLLFARVGIAYSPATGLPIESQEISQMVDRIMELPEKTKILLLAPIVRGRKGEYTKELAELQRKGFTRVKIDGELYEISEPPKLNKQKKHDIEVVIDRLVIKPDIETRLADSLQTTLELSDGLAVVELVEAAKPPPACGEKFGGGKHTRRNQKAMNNAKELRQNQTEAKVGRVAVFINGVINAGKTTIAKRLSEITENSVFIDGDDLQPEGLVKDNGELSESKISTTMKRIAKAVVSERDADNIFVAYPLRDEDWNTIKTHLQQYNIEPLCITLAPDIKTALKKRDKRELSDWEKKRIREMYQEKFHARTFSHLVIDNSRQSVEETVQELRRGLAIVEPVEPLPDRITFSSRFACPVSGFTIEEIEPRLFSFNSPFGACPECDGLGTEMFFDPDLVVPDSTKSLFDGAIAPWSGSSSKYYLQTIDGLAAHYGFSPHDAFRDLPREIQDIILYGSGDEAIKIHYHDGIRSFTANKPFEGVIGNLTRRYHETESSWVREEMEKFQTIDKCSACEGYRLKPEALAVRIGGLHIGQICEFTIEQAAKWFAEIEEKLSDKQRKIADKILREIRERLGFLINVGLDYLTLSRHAGTLSGGEAQRIRLASQVGSGLSGVLYVLDEPSIGLHQCDNDRLLATLKRLRDLGNTVLVVEHDEETMRAAQWLIDMGPGAGIHGGEVVAQGSADEVMQVEASITGQYLSGKKQIAVPAKRRKPQKTKWINIKGARANNLRNVDVDIPLGLFTCVTGVSGGGKSSLVIETLYKAVMRHLHASKAHPGEYDSIRGIEYIDKIIEIDQSPIGRTPRSNPATYTGAFTPIRDWFANLPESKARGYKAGRFSFNVKGGRCESCQGDGVIKIEMHFLPDVYVKCDVCKGARYNRETLEVKYRDKSIADILAMTVEEAVEFFSANPTIKEKCAAMQEVGLSYITLGQSATTLSGGEAQRVKLAKELSKRSTGRTLYILDEPTTGLHTEDICKLLQVLHKLVDAGNSVVVIEHNLDVIKTADWIIDIGPGGGDKGGRVVAAGTPEDVAAHKGSITGKYLKPCLKKGKKNKAA